MKKWCLLCYVLWRNDLENEKASIISWSHAICYFRLWLYVKAATEREIRYKINPTFGDTISEHESFVFPIMCLFLLSGKWSGFRSLRNATELMHIHICRYQWISVLTLYWNKNAATSGRSCYYARDSNTHAADSQLWSDGPHSPSAYTLSKASQGTIGLFWPNSEFPASARFQYQHEYVAIKRNGIKRDGIKRDFSNKDTRFFRWPYR